MGARGTNLVIMANSYKEPVYKGYENLTLETHCSRQPSTILYLPHLQRPFPPPSILLTTDRLTLVSSVKAETVAAVVIS